MPDTLTELDFEINCAIPECANRAAGYIACGGCREIAPAAGCEDHLTRTILAASEVSFRCKKCGTFTNDVLSTIRKF